MGVVNTMSLVHMYNLSVYLVLIFYNKRVDKFNNTKYSFNPLIIFYDFCELESIFIKTKLTLRSSAVAFIVPF